MYSVHYIVNIANENHIFKHEVEISLKKRNIVNIKKYIQKKQIFTIMPKEKEIPFKEKDIP